MKKFIFEKYEDFVVESRNYHLDVCSKCHGLCEVVEEDVICFIEEVELQLLSTFVLRCKQCEEEFLPEHTKRMIDGAYNCVKENNHTLGKFNHSEYREKFKYCLEQDYKYDYRDYYNIPGLCYDSEHSEKGFLTPVYFDKEALVYFLDVPQYEVDLFSESYGNIAKISPIEKNLYEWESPFGFNSNGKLVLWLGDIADMDERTKTILKAFNVDSDHTLIDSEFYQAQMNCIYSKPITEQMILLNKKIFTKNIKNKYQIDLLHLENECIDQEKKVKRPIVFTEQNVSEVINAYDKILVEGFNVIQLRLLYEKLYYEAERDSKYSNWQTIKLIEAILFKLSNSISNVDVASIISPLYILHDLRIYFSHLLPEDKISKTKQHIVNTLGVSNFENQEEIYNEEIKRLSLLFNYLAILSK
ncbi:MAG: hypothetical protein LUI60_00645 [Clostridia bacterium]|nr:hypothetical protein [Clostridia bacterium]